jgi:hypothetical protein
VLPPGGFALALVTPLWLALVRLPSACARLFWPACEVVCFDPVLCGLALTFEVFFREMAVTAALIGAATTG